MRLVAILGSPHGFNGNTGMLLKEVMRGAERVGAAATVLSLSDYTIRPCQGCSACHKTGKCVIQDDFPKVCKAMEKADGIILASPNYIFSVTAQMKALMDRCGGPIHCMSLWGKYAAAVVTSGSPEYQDVLDYMQRFLQALGCYSVGGAGATAVGLIDPAEREKAFTSAGEVGARLAHAIARKETFPAQDTQLIAFRARMQQLVKLHQIDWPFEYEYWQNHGMAAQTSGGTV